MDKTIGVLALQGAYQKHVECLSRLGVESLLIRKPAELDQCTGLIIPGGESTTMSLLIKKSGMYQPLRTFAQNHPVMGVCAGMIMMATEVDDDRVMPLGLIPFKALRNHYGRQVHSFTTDIKLDFDNNGKAFPAVFIRAPGADNISSDVQILASKRSNDKDEAIILNKGHHMALSFHPELTDDTRIHAYWLSQLNS
jgi:5'-phosphate synthase pdxT subunit